MDETIAAIATPPGVGALAVIRISGAQTVEVVSRCFSQSRRLVSSPRKALLGRITSAEGEVVDEVLATYFPNPASFTGEDIVELSTHGGLYVTQAVLSRLLDCGARPAEGGEFTQRAFMNGKLDLTQAEGIMDIISAQSDLALRSAQSQLQGAIQQVTEHLRESLIHVTAHLEAYIDFPEDDIDPETGAGLVTTLDEVVAECDKLLSTSYTGKLLREGARVVLCGEPNAGKSSLLNSLVGYDRALVSDIKGTTRDTVEEVVEIGGLPVRFVDTAGLREASEVIEKMGVERTYQEMESADLIIELIDGTSPPEQVKRPNIPAGVRHLTLLNKKDQGVMPEWDASLAQISCRDAEGARMVPQLISELLLDGNALTGSSLIAINARHQTCLRDLVSAVTKAIDEIKNQQDPELTAVSLREALLAIGDLTGRVDTEEVLGEIFAQFCIGK